MMIMTPFIFIINMVSRVFMKLLRVDPDAANKAMTEEELRTIVDVSHEDGVIESDEKKMIYNVFDLGDADAKDIMVPRVNVSFADVDSTYDELIDIFREDRFTRLPVYENTQDNIVGIINMKDLLCMIQPSLLISVIISASHILLMNTRIFLNFWSKCVNLLSTSPLFLMNMVK